MLPHAALAALALAGYAVVSSPTLQDPAGTHARGTVACPSGTVPLGGGVGVHPVGVGAHVNGSFPSRHGWVADVSSSRANGVVFDVQVVCARRPDGYAVTTRTVDEPGETQTAADAACPAGTRPLGGGARTSADHPAVHLASSAPNGGGWQAAQDDGSSVDARLTAYAVCGRVAGYVVASGPSATLPGLKTTRIAATCPPHTVPLGGGATSTATTLDVALDETFPDTGAWDAVLANAGTASAAATPFAVCARAA
jgi:hypothetical protein